MLFSSDFLPILRNLAELGHYPDIVTYNTIINCLRRHGRFSLRKRFAREMLERHKS
jgi:pentatricopeptide repeat protein